MVEGVSPGEPSRRRPDEALSARMSTFARRDTAPELALRRALYRRGLRYRLQVPVPGAGRRRIDLAFAGKRVAVFVDGCFWHGCPAHGTDPASNSAWWAEKILTNQQRDADTTTHLQTLGWTVVRFWEHEDPGAILGEVEALVGRAEPGRGRRRQ